MKIDPPLADFLAVCRARVEAALDAWLPEVKQPPTRLHEAMRYAVLGPGKRVRPVLAYAAGQALGIAPQRLDGPACALEMIHAYSLIHDDLPAMDNDDLRRGRPTCHRAFDEATAILAGDALQTLAFQVLATDPGLEVGPGPRLRMVELLARAAGSRGMAGGQALDLDAVGRELNIVELEHVHILKTGALIRASLGMAALVDESADPDRVRHLDRYAKCIGLAFQVQDDILDVTSDTATLGKTQGKDQRQAKATYPTLLGLNGAREKAQSLCDEASAALEGLGDEADPLRWLACYIVGRGS